MIVGVSDKLIMPWLEGKEYLDCSDEAESIAIAAGHWLAKKKRATVFMSADGFMNTLNFLTSWVYPDKIEMDIIISIGRTEKQHYIATAITKNIVNMLKRYDQAARVSYTFIEKQ